MSRFLRFALKKPNSFLQIKSRIQESIRFFGAQGGNRTRMESPPHDFESCASASSATRAGIITKFSIINKILIVKGFSLRYNKFVWGKSLRS